MIYGEMIHHLHPDHKIKLVYDERPYICDGCHEFGFYTRYTCGESSCNFHLHKCCAMPEPTLTHPFFPDSVFLFLQSGEPHCRHCDACGRSIAGFVYHCFDKDWDLHPSCATLPDTLVIDGDKKLLLKRKSFSRCDKCHQKQFIKNRKSWTYVSSDKDCHLHIGCVKDLLCNAWEDKYLKGGDGETKPEGLRIQLDNVKNRSGKKFKKYCKDILKISLSAISAVLVGDPSALVVALISSLLDRCTDT